MDGSGAAAPSPAPAPQKRAWRRWTDDEERLLAATVLRIGTRSWDRIAQEMKSPRTPKQLQDHWADRQQQCVQLYNDSAPADRPPMALPPSTGKRKYTRHVPVVKRQPVQRVFLENVPSVRYRPHPYSKSPGAKEACEAAHAQRVRGALTRFITHKTWLEEDLFPQPGGKKEGAGEGAGEGGAGKAGDDDDDGRMFIYSGSAGVPPMATDARTRAAQGALIQTFVEAIDQGISLERTINATPDLAQAVKPSTIRLNPVDPTFNAPGDMRVVTDESVLERVAQQAREGKLCEGASLDLDL